MISTEGKRLFIARHGETVFNRIARMQGQAELHTPLTWDGCVQARVMGRALANYLGDDTRPQLWSSSAGRALQTLALIAEEIDADWHRTSRDDRLLEIDVGTWSSRTYADIAAEIGPIVDLEHKLFSVRPQGGEWYDDVAARLTEWIGEQRFEQDMLVICHGMTARVLRGLMLGHPPLKGFDAPIAGSLAQGSMVMIRDGVEELVIDGEGAGERA
ncbi:MAG: histidine phosphatase family protein [Sphingorhabdus sp.]|uniref:histidine phosphatase family protein n=1 Tax=Sphingorhabdus sp. TaxID=1902408 RepID=UPI0038FC8787